MFFSKLFLVSFIILFTACGDSALKSENKFSTQFFENNETELILKMERTPCFGNCPVYTLTIQPDGKFSFDNVKSIEKGVEVIKIKHLENKLSEEKINQIISEIDKADFFSLENSYTGDSDNCPTYWTDSSTVILSISLREKEKTITHYLGCEENDNPADKGKIYPQQLYNLENKIDEIVETGRWIGERK